MSCAQTNLRSHYFKVIEHGTKLFNAHRLLNTLSFLLGLIGMIIIFATDEVKRPWMTRRKGWPEHPIDDH
jgi:hypothetical protein